MKLSTLVLSNKSDSDENCIRFLNYEYFGNFLECMSSNPMDSTNVDMFDPTNEFVIYDFLLDPQTPPKHIYWILCSDFNGKLLRE
jgi:hypothetical protein